MEAVGRRKTAIARVRATASTKNSFTINDKPLEQYFGTPQLRKIVTSPVEREGFPGKYESPSKFSVVDHMLRQKR